VTCDEHLAWCKQRALEYVDAGDLTNAVASSWMRALWMAGIGSADLGLGQPPQIELVLRVGHGVHSPRHATPAAAAPLGRDGEERTGPRHRSARHEVAGRRVDLVSRGHAGEFAERGIGRRVRQKIAVAKFGREADAPSAVRKGTRNRLPRAMRVLPVGVAIWRGSFVT
jgi:hypothetical protein